MTIAHPSVQDWQRYLIDHPETGELTVARALFSDPELFALEMRYLPEQQGAFCYFGFYYEHVLRPQGDELRIARKKILLLNDVVEGVLNIYHV
jgi:hypothetical protein